MTPGGVGAPASEAANAGSNQAHCVPCGGAAGMAAWWVDEPYLNLWAVDEPLSYLTSSGQPMTFRWTYRPREGFASGDLRVRQWDGADLVPIRIREAKAYATMDSAAWCHNWWSEIVVWDTWFETNPGNGPTLSPMPTPTNAYCSFSTNYEVLAFLGDGSTLYFQGTNGAGTPNGPSKVRLEMLTQSTNKGPEIPLSQTWNGIHWPYQSDSNGVLWVDNPRFGFRLVYPDGSQDVYGFVYLMPWATWPARNGLCPYRDLVPSDARCSAGSDGTNHWNAAYDYTARAYLTQRIDPQGRITRIGYQKTQNPGVGQPAYRVGYVVDPDGRTNSYSYNPNNLYQLQQIVDAWGRTNSVTYSGGTEGLLASITDGGGLSSSFQYQPAAWGTNYCYGYTNAWCSQVTNLCSGWMTNLTTPYGTTTFTWLETPGTNGFDTFTERALLASEPNGAHQLYYYRHNAQGLLPDQVNDVPAAPGYGFDPGGSSAADEQLYYRNSLHWDRRQFAALSGTVLGFLAPSLPPAGGIDLESGLANLTGDDYRKASLQHWLLGGDGISITGSVSSQREASPDAAGQTEGVRTWYDYAGKDPNNPQMEGSEPLVGCIARLLADGSSQYSEWDYTTIGLPLQRRESYSLADGSVGVRTNVYQYGANAIDLLSVTNSLGQYVNLGYNTKHQLSSATNALGQVDRAAYESSTGHLTNLALASGLSVAVAYYPSNGASPNGGVISNVFWSPLGLSVTATWTNGLPRVMHVNGTGLPDLWQTNAWDGLNRLLGTAFRDGTSVSNVYDRLHLGASKDRRGYWTSFGWDALEDLIAITDALSNQTQYGWCDCGALDSITDALTNTTSIYYNNQGIWTNITFADNSSLTRTLDALGRPVVVADGQGRWLAGAYNNQSSLVTLSNAAGLMWSVVLDAADRPVQVTVNGVTHTNTWDSLNQLLTRTWLSGGTPAGVEGFLWSTNGLRAYTNQNGKVTWWLRDGAGRPLYVTNANQEVIQLAWNALNELTDLWDGRTNHTGWDYNEYGWLTNQVDAQSHVVLVLTRDPNGQVTNRWTRQFGNTVYRRDPTGWVTNLLYVVTGQSVSYALDALHQVIGMADQVGTTQFGYTPTGQLQSETAPWPGSTLSLGYTEGLRTSLSLGSFSVGYHYDSAWRLDTLSSSAGTFGYSHDPQRSTLPALLTLPNGAWVTNHYDSLARLDYTALVNPWGHVLDGYGYGLDLLGLKTNIARDLGLTSSTVSVGYDNAEQITSWSARESNGVLRQNEQFTYAYDQAGNLRLLGKGSLTETFGCDSLNQITNITRSGTLTLSGATPAPATNVTVNSLTAERYGDMTFACTNLTLTNGQNTFTIIAQNAYGVRATNSAIYNLPSAITLANDSNGNLTNDGTRSFAYSPENQLTNITVAGQWKVDFVHDGLGRRCIERDYAWQGGNWQLTNEVHILYDGYVPIQGRDTNNNVLWTLTRGIDLSGTLAGAGGIGGLLARTDTNGSTLFHADGAGNITGLMNGQENMAARYMYGAFGSLILQGGPMANVNVMGVSSMPQMKGLVSFPARDYSPDFLRFLTRDPLGIGGGPNAYQFVGNNPINRFDPYGLAWYNPVDWYNGIVNAISDPIARLWTGGIDAQGNAAITGMLVDHQYNGMQDFQMQHPGYGGDITAGNTDANAAIANMASGAANLYVTAATMVTPTATGARCVTILAKNGTKITGFTGHGVERAVGGAVGRAGVKPQAILDALENPVKITSGVDQLGRPFQIFVGQDARVVVNPQTGNVVSVNPLSGAGAH
jgi:RHS repeat-associated protein